MDTPTLKKKLGLKDRYAAMTRGLGFHRQPTIEHRMTVSSAGMFLLQSSKHFSCHFRNRMARHR